MLFNSLHLLVFFPLVVAVYFGLPHRGRWAWLLAASACFYAVWVPAYLLVLAAVIGVDYVAGRLIEPASGRRRRLWLGMSVAANLGILALFKYYDFAADNLGTLLSTRFASLAGARAVGTRAHGWHGRRDLRRGRAANAGSGMAENACGWMETAAAAERR